MLRFGKPATVSVSFLRGDAGEGHQKSIYDGNVRRANLVAQFNAIIWGLADISSVSQCLLLNLLSNENILI